MMTFIKDKYGRSYSETATAYQNCGCMTLKFFTTPRVALVTEIDIGLHGNTIEKAPERATLESHTVQINSLDREPTYTMSDRVRTLRQYHVRQ